MGYGEFGSNGSVHWKIVHTADGPHNGYITGRDPHVPCDNPDCKDSKLNFSPEVFIVKLRFASAEAAREALKNAKFDGGTVELRVPAAKRARPQDPPPWEVTVIWETRPGQAF